MRRMKDSGVAWIGEIPEGWEVCQFKRVHKGTNVGEGIDKSFWSDDSNDKVFYTAGILPIWSNYKDFPQWKYTGENDILLSRNGTPYVYLPLRNALYTDHIIRVNIKQEYDKRFIRYVISQSISFEIVDSVSIATWSASLWNEQRITVPPLSEQSRIASFLDAKCGEIDSLISLQEEMISELQAYKQSVITEAVTKGLDKNVKMKDSGEEWIGEIPEGWEITKIKRISNTTSGSTPRSISNSDSSTIKWFRTTDINENIVSDSPIHLTEIELKSASCPMLSPNTCLVAMYGGAGTIGKFGMLSEEATINQALCSISVHAIMYCKFMFYILKGIRSYWMKFASGTRKDPNINQDIVRNMLVPLPPLSEQTLIAAYLDTKTSQIDSLISLKHQKIEELKEYKKSIIYEYVTGKKEVI